MSARSELPAWARDRLEVEERMGEMRSTATPADMAVGLFAIVVIIAQWLFAIGLIAVAAWGLIWLVGS